MSYHDRWRSRKRLYKLDYKKYLKKYLPRVLRHLAYPSLALGLHRSPGGVSFKAEWEFFLSLGGSLHALTTSVL